MTTEDVTRSIWRNTVSNYVCVIVRMGLGLVLFRMLYQGLSREEFGFWALLWSVFGFGILLDFGFGFTAIKRVAELSVHEKWDELSRVLSTIIYLYVLIGIFFVAFILLSAGFLIELFNVTPENREPFREMLIIFFLGMAVGFPLGIFPEILIGQHRICLSNVLFIIGTIGNFIFISMGMHLNWDLKVLIVISLLSGIIPCVLSAFFALRHMPKVKIQPRLFSVKMIRETMRFSIFAYVSTLSHIILSKTDQLVISTAMAVSAVTIYQAGAKIGEMFALFTQQLPETFSPVAAHMHAKKDRTYLRQLLINGTRFSVMIATPFYLIGAFYMDGLLTLITGEKVPAVETYWIGQVLLFWSYMGLMTQSVPKRLFMMCGHERRLTGLTVAEAVLNLTLSITLILYFRNVLCVAIGSLVSTMIFGWFYIWPWAAREAGLTVWSLGRTVLVPIWIACLPLLALILAARFVPAFELRSHTLFFMSETGVATLVGAFCIWQYALSAQERATLGMKISQIFARTRTPVETPARSTSV